MALASFFSFVVPFLVVSVSARRIDKIGNVDGLALEVATIQKANETFPQGSGGGGLAMDKWGHDEKRTIRVKSVDWKAAGNECDVVVGGIRRSKGGKAWSSITEKVKGCGGRGKHCWCRCPRGWSIHGLSKVCLQAESLGQSVFSPEQFRGHECACAPNKPHVVSRCSQFEDQTLGHVTVGISYNRRATIQEAIQRKGLKGLKGGFVKNVAMAGVVADKIGTDITGINNKLLDEVPPLVMSGLQKKFFVVESRPIDQRQSITSKNTGMILMDLKVCGLANPKKFFDCNIGKDNKWFGKRSLLGGALGAMFHGAVDLAVNISQKVKAEVVDHARLLIKEVILSSIRASLQRKVMVGLKGKVGSPNVCVFDSGLIIGGPDGKPYDSSSHSRYLHTGDKQTDGEFDYPPSKFDQLLDPKICPQVTSLPPEPPDFDCTASDVEPGTTTIQTGHWSDMFVDLNSTGQKVGHRDLSEFDDIVRNLDRGDFFA